MKTLTIKTKDGGMRVYGMVYVSDENGKNIPQTDEQQSQHLYDSIVSDVLRQEFEKNITSILENYLGRKKDWESCKIEFSYKDKRKYFLNIINR